MKADREVAISYTISRGAAGVGDRTGRLPPRLRRPSHPLRRHSSDRRWPRAGASDIRPSPSLEIGTRTKLFQSFVAADPLSDSSTRKYSCPTRVSYACPAGHPRSPSWPGEWVRSSRLALSWEDEGWLGYGPQVKRCLPTRRKRPLQLRQAFAKYVSAETPGCICPAPGLRQSRRPVRVQT